MKIQTACAQCSGRGSTSRQSCRFCNGRGNVVSSTREVEVKVPPGVEDGTQIRLSGEGVNGADLFIAIVVEKHPSLERHQRNLISRLDVPYSTLVLGGEAKFVLFDSEIRIKIPPRTRAGSRLRMKNQGMPAMQNPSVRGDLFVELGVFMPSLVSPEYEKAIRSLSKFEECN
jgi:molecular chaperone DnaJ